MSGLLGRFRKDEEPPREDVLYVHLRDDGGVFTVKGNGVQGLMTADDLLTEVARVSGAAGLILYSRDHPDRDPPDRVTLLFQRIVDRRPTLKLVDKPHPDAVERGGLTTLMAASYNGHLPGVRDLLSRGAITESQDELGYSALMYACNAGAEPVVEELLGAGADPNLRDAEGNSALMFAAQHGHDAIVDALLAAGADKSLTGKAGFTALDFARQNGHRFLLARLAVLPVA